MESLDYFESKPGLWQEIIEHHQKYMKRNRISTILWILLIIAIIAYLMIPHEYVRVASKAVIVIEIGVWLLLGKLYPDAGRRWEFHPGHTYLITVGSEYIFLRGNGKYYIPDGCGIYGRNTNFLYCKFKFDYDCGQLMQAVLRASVDFTLEGLTERGREAIRKYLIFGKSYLRKDLRDWIAHVATVEPDTGNLIIERELLKNNPFGFQHFWIEMLECRMMVRCTIKRR